MENVDVILWDVDGTLLNFEAAEEAAIRSLFRDFRLGECTDGMLSLYSQINRRYWQMLERGEMTKEQILVGRFREFFAGQSIDPAIAPEFNSAYQSRLGDTIVFRDGSYDIVKSLRGRIRQYAVSNGTVEAQTKKLRNSGLDKLLDGVFLSEEVGFEKPAREFFESVFAAIGPVDRERVIIVGDSLTSEIAGGRAAGIRTCWYNPAGAVNSTTAVADVELQNLGDLERLL